METFGEWVFAVSFVSIFRTFVNYGFDLTATRSVSVHRNDRNYISTLYSTVVLTRFIIFGLSCLALFVLGMAFNNIWNVILLAQLSMLVLVGEALFPIWLFQGMEQMSTITYLRLGYRALFVLVVILVVQGPQYVLYIPVVEAVGSLFAGLIALRISVKRYALNLGWPSIAFVRREVAEGASVFTSYVAVHFYTTINTILLGIMAGSVQVTQYSIAEKVYSAIRGMLGPVVQALFPTLSRQYEEDIGAYRRHARNIAVAFFVMLIALALAIFLVAEPIVRLIAGQTEPVAVQALQILAVAMVFAFGTLLSVLLVVQKEGKTLVRITFATMAVNLIIVFPLLHYYGVIGMAVAFLITQVFQTVVQLVANAELTRLTSRPKQGMSVIICDK